jgi:transcriptional regulator with XRE-family HTH domain
MAETVPFRNPVELGALLGRARRAAGLSQAELARRLGTTQSAVSRWERGREEPRLSTLASILRACGLRFLLTVEDDVDRAQIREQLAMTPMQRLRSVANVSRTLASARAVAD